MRITYINHACVRVETRDLCVLCDPWVEGPAFNNGWDLLIETPLSHAEIMEGVTHIWISHEHPDHFSPGFLAKIAKTYANAVTILFQHTADGRVKRYCESRGFKVVELAAWQPLHVGGTRLTCANVDFYDSWLHVDDGQATLLNLNDCAVDSPVALRELRRRLGRVDVLLTQFSYAAWKGGRSNRSFREFAARRKLQIVANQVASLNATFAVPFASMVYFSNCENDYLNDSVNDVDAAAEAIQRAGAAPLVLYPGDACDVGREHDNTGALQRFRAAYATLADKPRRASGESVPLDVLTDHFNRYRQRAFSTNSEWLITFCRRLPLLGLFHPVLIRMDDLDTVVSVSVVDGFHVAEGASFDVSMHSSCLDFILVNDFGFDTLTVNGRFEATPLGFERMTKSLALGSLNAMGLNVSLKLLNRADLVLLLLRRLVAVVARLRSSAIVESDASTVRQSGA